MAIWGILICPLLGSLINGILARRAPKSWSNVIGVTAITAAFVLAIYQYFFVFMPAEYATTYRFGFDWISTTNINAPFALAFDRLSGLMTLLITGVCLLAHIFATGYLSDSQKTGRFFSYFNLLVFMLLLLVLGDNMLVMLVGWQGISLCSYLLIGYHFAKDTDIAAGTKTFLMNRIGDIGLLIGIFLAYRAFGTVSFFELKEIIVNQAYNAATTLPIIAGITLALFFAVCVKSAQLPFFTWLPDSVAGPTPVVATIHALTTSAGVYLLCRLSYLFYLAPGTMNVMTIVGGATAVFAASIALVQNDVKKVLAYSTVSQLGMVIAACGAGAFWAGFLYVWAHACIKALMFMGAGSVVVAMNHNQDMRKMGGLRQYMPITHLAFAAGLLCMVGTPGLSGFFSYVAMLYYMYLGSGPALWIIGLLTSGLTAFYMTRLFLLTFWGEHRTSDAHTARIQESPASMWAPMVCLGVLCVGIGWLAIPEFLGGHNWWQHHFASAIQVPPGAEQHWAFLSDGPSQALSWGLMSGYIMSVLCGFGLATYLYMNGPHSVLASIQRRLSPADRTLSNGFWVNEIYNDHIVLPAREMSLFLSRVVDVKIIDGITDGLAQACTLVAGLTSFKMSGSVNRHGMVVVIGLACLLTALLF